MNTNDHLNGYRVVFREEMKSYLEEAEVEITSAVDDYINHQIELVMVGLFSDTELIGDQESDPRNYTADKLERDYFRESIGYYGTIYNDYPL